MHLCTEEQVLFFQVAVPTIRMWCLYKAIYGCFYQVNILEVYAGGE